jgi:hypothetical protein
LNLQHLEIIIFSEKDQEKFFSNHFKRKKISSWLKKHENANDDLN